MNRSVLFRSFLFVFLMLCGWVAQTQNQKPARPVRLEKVKPDLYMIAGEGGNVAVYVTNEGVILVDDMFDRNHDDILAQVKAVTDKPLRYVLNTHQHDDHAGGDYKMLPIAEVIAHKNARANLVAKRQPYFEDTPGTPIGLPRITFADETAVHLGGKEVRATYYGRGHTNGDAVIYFPELKVIHTGDLFLARAAAGGGRAGGASARGGAAPRRTCRRPPPGVSAFVDYSQGGSFIDWSRTLEQVLEDRLRHRHPRPRAGVEERRCGEGSPRSRDHAQPAPGFDQRRQNQGRDRRHPRNRLRLASQEDVRPARRPAAVCSFSRKTR